jgi:pimeloyl-ACP methyl ester carboxylesterase
MGAWALTLPVSLAAVRALAVATALLAGTTAAAAPAAPAPPPDPPTAVASAPSLAPCRGAVLRGFRCGRIRVPFERADPSLGTLGIGFAVRRRDDRSRPSKGTIFAVEGGPGYPSTGTAVEYAALFAGLLRHRDLVLVDARGTGLSGALTCPGSQGDKLKVERVLANCATKLGPRFESYRTSAAADDIDAVRRALGIGRIVLYGDSYGTFLGQSYAFRHGRSLRALVLDSAYPLSGESPWYPSGPRTGMRSLTLACARSPRCEGDARAHLRRAVAKLRRHGHSAIPLLNAIWAAGYSPPRAYERINARIEALLASPPRPYPAATPLRRPARGSAKLYSGADEMVVSCNDYPMLWKKTASRADRRAQLERSIRSYPRRRFAPFTPREVSESIFLAYRYCLTAPVPGPLYEPPATPGARAPGAPVLVVSGEMDDVTTPTEGRYVTADFPNARQVIIPNAGHVDALYFSKRRAARAIRAFVARH